VDGPTTDISHWIVRYRYKGEREKHMFYLNLGTSPGCVAHAQLLKLQRSGRFPRQDRPTKIKYAQSHKVKVTRGTDNLTTTGMNEIELEGKYQIIRTVFTYFFSRIVI
jgi:hypothetical protein